MLALVALAAMAGGCSSSAGDARISGEPGDDPARPHHTAGGFRNNYTGEVNKSLGDLLRWRWHDLAVARQAAGLAEDDFFVLRIGETRWLPPRK